MMYVYVEETAMKYIGMERVGMLWLQDEDKTITVN